MTPKKTSPYVTRDNIAACTRRWLAEIAAVNTHAMLLAVPRSALLVIDMQRFFTDPAGAGFLDGSPAIMPNVERLTRAFREAERPVIYTRHAHHPQGLDLGIMGQWWAENIIEGTPESEVHPGLAPRAPDKVVVKHRYSAFFETDLETILRGAHVTDLVLCGVMTNMCVESTARDAYFRNYRVLVPADATAAPTEAMHRASLLNLAYGFAFITTTAQLVRQLTTRRRA